MKFLLLFSLLFVFTKSVHGQGIDKNIIKRDTSLSRDTSVVEKYNYKDVFPSGELKRIRITVDPKEAGKAFLTILKLSEIIDIPNFKSTYWYLKPDTIGFRTSPLSIFLHTGNYELIVSAKGFKDEIEQIEVNNENSGHFNIELLSLQYLRNKRRQWSTVKWINGAVALAAGAASYYFYYKLSNSEDKYNNAVSSEVINNERAEINRARKNYKTSTGIALTALGGFAVSWLIELSF